MGTPMWEVLYRYCHTRDYLQWLSITWDLMQIFSKSTVMFFAAVNHLGRVLRKYPITSIGSKGHTCGLTVIGRF